jgi:hypothetical protein
MAERQLGGPGYLQTIGQELLPEIDVLWTGPEIVSRHIPLAHLEEVRPRCAGHLFFGITFTPTITMCAGFIAGLTPQAIGDQDCHQRIARQSQQRVSLNFVPLRTIAAFVASARRMGCAPGLFGGDEGVVAAL